MNKKIRTFFLVLLIVTLGSFTSVFAANNTASKYKAFNTTTENNATITLTLFMKDSTINQCNITKDVFNDFLNWYKLRANAKTLVGTYTFNLPADEFSPARKITIFFNNIESFEIVSNNIPTTDRTNTLTLLMENSTIREYSLTQDELTSFNDWYNLRANKKTSQAYFMFNVPADDFSPDRKDYVLFDNIKKFQVQ
ncbi:hypothetical protein [Clostridium felsineum]|uniref:hypothetical protein n=1 Tax=Clostridium felsineum TaxID=36839 RepID=UPI00098CAE95|nr:hypothetical protein [Clostridium felsineum]URZ14825.1 hypothetical protein CLFE_008380 [Clostridium felsineum DSM 794]